MRLLLILASLVLGGCSAGPANPTLGPAPLPMHYSEITGSVPRSADTAWWTAFGDPTLDRAMRDGLAGNLDIRSAILRIDAARADVVVAGSGGLPAINFGASYTRSREEGEMKTVDGPVDTSLYNVSAEWLIDVFGEVRAQVQSAKASRDAAIAAVSIARLMLLSDIGASYVDARYYQELGAIGARALESRQRTLRLTRELAAQGVASQLDVNKALEAVDAIRAELPGYDANFRRAAHRMSTLMGRPAATMVPTMQAGRGQPIPAFDADAGVPADLLRNRPDIAKAEREFAASLADIGYARAQLYPTITFSGSITPSYVSTNLKSGNLTTWSFGPSLRLPIFEGGRLRANVRIAVSVARRKEVAWRGVVLKAVEDVENALVAYNREKLALKSMRARVDALQKTVGLSNAAYDAGMTSLLETLDSERQLFDAQSRLAASRRALALNYIALNIAVGRGLPGPGRADAARAHASNVTSIAPNGP